MLDPPEVIGSILLYPYRIALHSTWTGLVGGKNGFCYFFSKDLGRKFVNTINFILKAKVIALGLVFLLYTTTVLLLLGTNYLQNKRVGLSPARRSGICVFRGVVSCSSESPLLCCPGNYAFCLQGGGRGDLQAFLH